VATTLIITNDFPPRVGGIESFVGDVVELLERDVVIYTSSAPGWAEVDRRLAVEVVRAGSVLLPSPAATRQAVDIFRRSGASRVLFGAAAPLGLMAGALRRAGAVRMVALTHGHETWWAALPGARSLLRRLADDVDHVSTVSDFTAARIAPALSPAARSRMIRVAPPVDTSLFAPADPAHNAARRTDRPRAVAVGRLVQQKGFGTLLRAWRLVLDSWSGPATPELVLVGDGPQRRQLTRLAQRLGLTPSVRFIGAVARPQVVNELQAADVFVLLMRTRLAGLNPEGLGLAAVEAAACGLPVIVGDSGGAAETVLHGRTGQVVDPHNPQQAAECLSLLLQDPALARCMGAAGRRFVTDRFGSQRARETLRRALDLP